MGWVQIDREQTKPGEIIYTFRGGYGKLILKKRATNLTEIALDNVPAPDHRSFTPAEVARLDAIADTDTEAYDALVAEIAQTIRDEANELHLRKRAYRRQAIDLFFVRLIQAPIWHDAVAILQAKTEMQQADSPKSYRSKLHQGLVECFNEEELKTLCFEMGLDYENFPAQGKAGKAREIVAHFERTNGVSSLVEQCRRLRPNGPWDEIPKQPCSKKG